MFLKKLCPPKHSNFSQGGQTVDKNALSPIKNPWKPYKIKVSKTTVSTCVVYAHLVIYRHYMSHHNLYQPLYIKGLVETQFFIITFYHLISHCKTSSVWTNGGHCPPNTKRSEFNLTFFIYIILHILAYTQAKCLRLPKYTLRHLL